MVQEKKRKVHGRRRRTQSSKPTSSFPVDLTSEILLRLPEKSLVKFRCVSKLWLSITTDPYFINLFETRTLRSSLLLCFKKDENLVVSSISQHHQTLDNSRNFSLSSHPIDLYHMKFQEYNYMPPTESVHGLICFQEPTTPIVWNPSTRQFLTLPKPRLSLNDITVLLGYDPIEGKHKVVCLPYNTSCDVCRVLTLGSAQESWRTVKVTHKHRSNDTTSGRCINGVVYYLAYHADQTRVWVIMSFDVRSEKFDMIKLPSVYKDMVLIYEGKLAFVENKTMKDGKKNTKNGFTLCILEDAKKQKWSSKSFLASFGHFDEKLGIYLELQGFSNGGEFIYVPSMICKSSYILFYDSVRNKFRRFELEDIAEDKSRLNNGVRNRSMYALHVFPNHVENQMSLF